MSDRDERTILGFNPKSMNRIVINIAAKNSNTTDIDFNDFRVRVKTEDLIAAVDRRREIDALELAILFHETYERLAPNYGYETRTETRKFDPNTPNGKLMVAVCDEIIKKISEA
jgi:hypothetical protein